MNFKKGVNTIPDMDIWRATHGGFTFVIVHEQRTGPQFANWTGYTASWRPIASSNKVRPTRIDGGPWSRFVDAEEACKATYKQLKARN